MRSFVSPTFVALAVALSAGCGDPLSPTALAGTYALEQINGGPLPLNLGPTETGSTFFVADTIRLNPDGTGTRRTITRMALADGATEPPGWFRPDEVRSLNFRVELGRVTIRFNCGIDELCAGGFDPVTYTGETLIFERHPTGYGRAVYRRVSGGG